MRHARKLLTAAIIAIAALAITATTATAQGIEVLDEDAEEHCSAVTLVGHTVSGSCHVEFQSTEHIPLVVQTAGGPVTLMNCDLHLELRVDENGEGYATAVTLSTPVPPPNPGCTRAPCDEATGAMIPWRIHFEETAAEQNVELTFCLRTIASGPGGAGTSCELHIPWTDLIEHNYEIGAHSTHTCENLPPVSLQNVHLVNETDPHQGTEDIEIIHTGN